MSEGYASRLSHYPDKGICGQRELFDSKRVLSQKLQKLARWVKESNHLVVLTGAGISTSAGIPDFRGPQGVWTLEQKKKEEKENNRAYKKRRKNVEPLKDFSLAKPTLTHRALTKLSYLGKLKFCITQNVDGLHRRSGMKRAQHAILHGCAFTERCESCGTEYFRDYDVGGMSFQKTGRQCDACNGGDLRDTLLDWEDCLPEDDLERAERECENADLVLCLGTSLRIEPAGSLPMKAARYVIVNLQETAKDKRAAMIIRAPVDDVMEDLMSRLGHDGWEQEDPFPIERVSREIIS